jgi:Icc-related predicted phosphoesterase
MGEDLTLFYAADLHGSDVCFKKWLNAARHYGADAVIIGGDLTGKVLVPLYRAPDGGWVATRHGRRVELASADEVAGFKAAARAEGAYAFETTPEEVAEIQGSLEKERAVFERLKRSALEEWVALADERLADSRVRALVMPGNDDPPELDDVLASSRRLENVQGKAVELGPGIWMASRGESTITPWRTPREVPEATLGRLIEEAVDQVPAGVIDIWNVHNPPYRTGIDSAPRLDEELRVQYGGSGEPDMVPVGSTEVRRLIEERQPALALHGHIHEGRGRYALGRTVGFNPGSVYSDGTLYGVLVSVSPRKGLRHYTLTSG